MPPTYSIRTTVEADWPRVRELRIENATENPISYGATLETTLAMTEEDWRLRARRGQGIDTTSLAAIELVSGRWVGMMAAQVGDADGTDPVLTGVYVSPDFRGRKLGTADALLDQIIRWSTGRGSALRLYVHDEATPALRFYARRGFTPTGRVRPLGFIAGRTIEMVLALPA